MANLCSYVIHYTSFSGKPDWIKVDYLCEVDIDLPVRTVPTGYELFAFVTDYEIKILDRGCLVADKLTALSLDTIGLPEKKSGDIPKQIFDIGSQIRLASKNDLCEILKAFDIFTNFKRKIYDRDPRYTVTQIIDGIKDALFGFFMLDVTAVTLTKEQDDKFRAFMGTYLGSHIYRRTEHLGNILLILILVDRIKKYLSAPEKIDMLVKDLSDIVDTVNSYKTMDASEARRESGHLLSLQLPEFIRPYRKMLSGQPLEYIYLLRQIDL